MEIWAYGFVIVLYIQIAGTIAASTSAPDTSSTDIATSMSTATDQVTGNQTDATNATMVTTATTALPPTTSTSEPVATLDEYCNETLTCDTSVDLTCNNNTSTCDCPVSKYWNNSACVLAAIFNEHCNINITNSCKQHVNLTCDITSSLCKCETNNFWNISACVSDEFLTPRYLEIYDFGSKFINITWSHPNVSEDLELEYKVSWLSKETDNGNQNTNETNYSIPVEKPGDFYTISVTTVSLKDKTNATAQIKQRTIPLKPTNITINTTAVPAIKVQWIHNGIKTGFNGSLISEMDPLGLFNVTGNRAYTEFSNLIAGTNYTFTVTAYSGNDDHNNGDSRQFSMVAVLQFRTDTAEPGPPTLQNETKNKTSITLQLGDPLQPNGDIVGYLFEITPRIYPDGELGNRTIIFKKFETNASYVFSSLGPGIRYHFRIFTQNEGFNGTNSLNLTRKTDEDVPGEVEIQSTATSDMVTLTWHRPSQPNGDIIGYRILVNNTDSMNNCSETILLCSDTNCTHPQMVQNSEICHYEQLKTIIKNQKEMRLNLTGLMSEKNYSVYITAFTGAGEGDPASAVFMTIILAPKPVTNVKGNVFNSTSISVTWTNPTQKPGPTWYRITTHDMVKNTNTTGPERHGFETNMEVVTSLMEYWPYQFTVKICTAKGCETNRSQSNTTTLPAKPGYVQNVKVKLFNVDVDNCDDTMIEIAFTEPNLEDRNSKIIQYLIYEKNISPNIPLVDTPFHTTFYPYSSKNEEFSLYVKRLSPEYNYKFQIKAKIEMSSGYEEYIVHEFSNYTFIEKCGLTTLQTVLIVIGVLLALGVILGIAYICFKKRRQLNSMITGFRKMRKGDPQGGFIGPGDVEELDDIQDERPIVLSDIHELVEAWHKNDNLQFRKEYDDLKTISPKFSFDAANIDENKAKNRYYNILPFDHSRVKLIPVDDDPSSDYINANYIPGYNSEREYIAAQGPLPGTSADFWRMMWEQNVGIIVMLTKCQESHTEKCFQYWPDEVNEPRQYGDIVVNPVSISNIDKYNITVFHVSLGDNTRTIKHFHFLEWPDFTAKVEPNDMIDFVTMVRGHMTPDIKGPAVIHCSAGVGRTGTYITVDYLIQCVRDMALDEEVDIFAWVLQMRNYRTNMVQAMNQYSFLHDVLKVLVEKKEHLMQENEDDGLLYMNQTYENKAFDESEDLYENTKLNDQPSTEL